MTAAIKLAAQSFMASLYPTVVREGVNALAVLVGVGVPGVVD
jgi:hypothetical protein